MKKNIIVFVCTGNTCRSPMAEALFNDIIQDKGIGDEFEAFSRGVYAFDSDPASDLAIEAMKKEFGIDIKKHRAKVLDQSDISLAGLILTMTENHKQMILDIYPDAEDKVFTIREYTSGGGNTDVSDPFGGNYETYKECAFEIEELILELLTKI